MKLILAILFLALPAKAAVVIASSLLQADVLTAKNLCRHGDTLILPPGNETWSSGIVFTQYLTIKGAGTNSGAGLTKITFPQDGFLFEMAPIANGYMRIQDIYFSGGSYVNANSRSMIAFTRTNNNMRIDHCRFDYGKRVLWFIRTVWGVIDHCGFYNNDAMIAHSADATSVEAVDGDIEWARDIRTVHGTTNTLVVEDCWIRRDSLIGQDANEVLYGQLATTVTMRNCDINTSGMLDFGAFDAHGWPNGTGFGGRGTHGYEIYDVTMTIGTCYRLMNLRGGIHLMHDITITSPVETRDFDLLLQDEGILCCGTPTDRDWITNCHFWNITTNAVTYRPTVGASPDWPDSSSVIIENVDYFNRAPQAGDFWENYTELVYPHPRVTADDGGAGGSPSNDGRIGGAISGATLINGRVRMK